MKVSKFTYPFPPNSVFLFLLLYLPRRLLADLCFLFTALRLYPQLPVNIRVALKTTFLPSGGGPTGTSPVLIRRGTGVGYSVYHMHRMTSLYGPNANEFHPERWENTDLEKKVGWGFMPFHGGPRICLGSKLFQL